MKSISAIVGIVLLVASTLVVVLSTSEETYIEKKDAMVMKYVDQSNKALKDKNIKEAIKFAKLAIAVDPKNKKSFKAYESAMELKYKPSQEEIQEGEEFEQPSADEDEEEAPVMGC